MSLRGNLNCNFMSLFEILQQDKISRYKLKHNPKIMQSRINLEFNVWTRGYIVVNDIVQGSTSDPREKSN